MAEENTIKLNPEKPTTLEFEVKISGLDDTKPIVRFVIHDVFENASWTFNCTPLKDSMYSATFPAFPDITHKSRQFSVEVIVNEFFFIPAKGEVVFIGVNDVSFKLSTVSRPTVSTSFIVKQDQEPTKVKEALNDVVDIPGNPGPTNQLRLEKNPTEEDYHKNRKDETGKDSVSIDQIASHVIPGDTNVDNMTPPEEEPFDPRKVASNLIKSKLGTLRSPNVKGTLFTRTPSGKTRINGLEDAKTQQELDTKASKVKEILNSI